MLPDGTQYCLLSSRRRKQTIGAMCEKKLQSSIRQNLVSHVISLGMPLPRVSLGSSLRGVLGCCRQTAELEPTCRRFHNDGDIRITFCSLGAQTMLRRSKSGALDHVFRLSEESCRCSRCRYSHFILQTQVCFTKGEPDQLTQEPRML